jgi:hypothetical protein
MAINIIKGSDKVIVVRLTSQESGDPFDLTGVSYIQALFAASTDAPQDANGNPIPLFEDYVAPFTGDILSGSNVVSAIVDTSVLSTGDLISGPGIPAGALITKTPNDPTPSGAGTVEMSVAASTTAVGAALSAGNISVLSPALIGKMQIKISAGTTKWLESGTAENLEIQILKAGITYIVQFPGALNVIERLL